MPKRTDIKSILIIGAGPIIIGQACEFDYSGVQACKALREEGYKVILINSNPATIMTDPATADVTYIEPITWQAVEKIIAKERPDAILPTMGGQTALNCALDLWRNGVLDKYKVELIGATPEAIDKAEDRLKFKDAMTKIGLGSARSGIAHSMEEAWAVQKNVGFPTVIRPSFTLGGTGGGIAYNPEEFETICKRGLEASPTNELLIEESLLGWKEYEMEVVRDKADNCIIICSIENLDPMGVHTGDSITVAPAQTLTDKEYQIMRNASLAVLREIGVDTGGSNVQFSVNPKDGRMIVIEMNPRVSRSSALASKATGFPIAKVAAKLAVGYTLDELKNEITGGATPASFEPSIDYVVTKIPRFAFEKFPTADSRLTTQMKSVGEVMAMGRTFQESFQKALRGLEVGVDGMNEKTQDREVLEKELGEPGPERIWYVGDAFAMGLSVDEVFDLTKIDRWFLVQIEQIVKIELDIDKLVAEKGDDALAALDAGTLLTLKQKGFSDRRLAKLLKTTEKAVREARRALNVRPVYKRVDTCAAEFATNTAYLYSTYEVAAHGGVAECESEPTANKKIMVLGGGPNRIGQGIEFDYCCVHACYALKEAGYETIMINCNPETVSTDYDTADRLYFEPLTVEHVSAILDVEKSRGTLKGVIVQLGGQTPLKLAETLLKRGYPILGTSVDSIDLAEDRERFQKLLHQLKLKQPQNGIATNLKQALDVAEKIGFPLVIRPSYVLGGSAMRIVYDMDGVRDYISNAVSVSGASPVLLDKYLIGAIEVDVDALCDGDEVYVAGIMEHIEEAGVHSGDSACVMPPHSLSFKLVRELEAQTAKLARALKVQGLMNIQFAMVKNKTTSEYDVYVLEVNPRASRTVPFVAKATGVAVAKIAARLMAGEKLSVFRDQLKGMALEHTAVKAPVFPFHRFAGVDVLLGPEMKSTGEVMGIDPNLGMALAKAMMGASIVLPMKGKVFLSMRDSDKDGIIPVAKDLLEMGFSLVATGGTCSFLKSVGIDVTRINKVHEGQPHVVDAIINGDIALMINTTQTKTSVSDGMEIRRTALMRKLPYTTNLAAAGAMVQAIRALKDGELDVKPLQDYA